MSFSKPYSKYLVINSVWVISFSVALIFNFFINSVSSLKLVTLTTISKPPLSSIVLYLFSSI